MCLLAYFGSGAMPDLAKLETAGVNNPDGFGWAVHLGDEIATYRTMSLDESLATFSAARRANPHGVALWHARIGTSGTRDVSNVHPFPVAGDSRLILAHNGVLPLRPTDGRSDTRLFADTMLRPEYLDDESVTDFMGSWIGHSKLVVLSVHPATRFDAYIVNEHLGEWDETAGVWWSNTSYMERPTVLPRLGWGFRYGGLPADDDDDDDDGERVVCDVCESITPIWWGECEVCEACLRCGFHVSACECHGGRYYSAKAGAL